MVEAATEGVTVMNDSGGDLELAKQVLKGVQMIDADADDGSLLYLKTEILDLANKVHTNSKDHGWWEGKVDTKSTTSGLVQLILAPVDYEEKMVLIASEVAEAFEEYRKPDIGITQVYYKDKKPEGFPIEMADAFIRVLDLMGALTSSGINGWDFSGYDSDKPLIRIRTLGPDVGGHCFQVLRTIVACYDLDLEVLNHKFLPYVLMSIEQACLDLNVDLVEAVTLKTAYNSTRPYRHGGLRA